MAGNNQHDALSARFQQLVEQREATAQALAQLDATLEQIGSIIGGGAFEGMGGGEEAAPVKRRPGRPKGSLSTGASGTGVRGKGRKGRGRGRGRFEMSADETVMNFLRENRNASTQEVKAFWETQGRGGTADNTLSKLVKEGMVKRTPLEGQRGSRFALA